MSDPITLGLLFTVAWQGILGKLFNSHSFGRYQRYNYPINSAVAASGTDRSITRILGISALIKARNNLITPSPVSFPLPVLKTLNITNSVFNFKSKTLLHWIKYGRKLHVPFPYGCYGKYIRRDMAVLFPYGYIRNVRSNFTHHPIKFCRTRQCRFPTDMIQMCGQTSYLIE